MDAPTLQERADSDANANTTQPDDANALSETQRDRSVTPSVDEESDRRAENGPSAAAKPKRKRLTLQERLALAAKGKKSANADGTTEPSATSTSTSTASATATASASASTSASTPGSASGSAPTAGDTQTLMHDTTTTTPHTPAHDPAQSQTQSSTPTQQPASEDAQSQPNSPSMHTSNFTPATNVHPDYQTLKQKYDLLVEENRQLKSAPKPQSVKELVAKIDKQNITIEQLRQEGEALSLKELKLNETIKKLRSHNSNLESSLRDYASKDEESSEKMVRVEQILKTYSVKNIDQWVEKYEEMKRNLEETSTALGEIREQHWEDKYKESQQLYENELWEKKQALKEVSDLTIQFDMAKKQRDLDSESKNTIIAELKRELQGKKKEKTEEISRLERKIESLRLQSEGVHHVDSEDASQAKQIDYSEFSKLSENHHNLQQQYLSSQENWKLIESNLAAKIDTLTSSIHSLKKAKTKLSSDLRMVQANLSSKSDELDTALDEAKKMRGTIDDLTFQIQLKDDTIAELEDKLGKIQEIHNEERTSLMQKIAKLNDIIDQRKREADNSRNMPVNLDLVSRPTMSPRNNSWTEIRVGESCTTPSMSRHASSMFIHQNPSSTSFDVADDTFDDTSLGPIEVGETSNHAPSSASYTGKMPTSSLTMSGGNNIQLINKMSSTIRRLEIELVTIREESAQLAEEKEQLQQELLAKIKLSNENNSLKEEIANLQLQLADMDNQTQTMLEVIGEKSERVSELEADVEDLRDLCKLQVQQMMDIQGK
ncbi:Protein SGM1 [Meyerozyma sp. JA9]|nr:Protein SGM1 [Meyerozyma sp. JA9]